MKLRTVEIRDFFGEAGNMYGWDGSTVGVGISENLVKACLRRGEALEVIVRGIHRRVILPQRIINESEKHNSVYTTKSGTRLLVFKWNEEPFSSLMHSEVM